MIKDEIPFKMTTHEPIFNSKRRRYSEIIKKVIKILRSCLVYCNNYYSVIGIIITRNKRNCNDHSSVW